MILKFIWFYQRWKLADYAKKEKKKEEKVNFTIQALFFSVISNFGRS